MEKHQKNYIIVEIFGLAVCLTAFLLGYLITKLF